MKIPGYHLVPTMSHYLRMTEDQRNDLMLWLKQYFDGLTEVDRKAGDR